MAKDPVDRISRLENVLAEIRKVRQSNSDLYKMINVLNQEYKLEGGSTVEHSFQSYGWNLEQIIMNELDEYKIKKRKGLKMGAPSEAKALIIGFERDVEDEILRLKIENNINL
jgi:hypothetical protein